MKAAALPALPGPRAPALRSLPSTADWFNVRDAGARGDNKTDDTKAIQRAIDEHRTVYFPAGRYIVSDTLRLRPETVLVALHPNLTQIILPDRTPAFQGVGAPKALMLKMAGNVGVDAVISMVPVVGWVGDVFFRANVRNVKLLQAHLDKLARLKAQDGSITTSWRVVE